jgi:thiol-disulfide isomerase/thioredoxin
MAGIADRMNLERGLIMKKFLLLVLLAAVLAATACSSTNTPEEGNTPGSMAPGFTLQSLDGSSISLSDFRSRPVLLNFWATWCGPCRGEMPYLEEIKNDPAWSSKGLTIIAVDAAESVELVERFLSQTGLSLTVVIDPDTSVFMDYNIRAIPTTFFIDRDGIIDSVKIGAFFGKAEIEEHLEGITQ